MALLRDRHDTHDIHDIRDDDAPDVRPTERDDFLEDTPRHERVVLRRNSFGQTIRTVVATAFIVAVVAVMAMNTDDVVVDAGFETYTVALWAAIGLAALAGLIAGSLLGWRSHRR